MSFDPKTDAEFDDLSWHDNLVYGLRLDVGAPGIGNSRNDLVLDIDHIVATGAGTSDRPNFLVAPATLAFHNVTDLRIAIDFDDSGLCLASNEIWIGDITRVPQPIEDQQICLDQVYYFWRIEIVSPGGNEITFGASGFTQTLRAEAVLQAEQRLSPVGRA